MMRSKVDTDREKNLINEIRRLDIVQILLRSKLKKKKESKSTSKKYWSLMRFPKKSSSLSKILTFNSWWKTKKSIPGNNY